MPPIAKMSIRLRRLPSSLLLLLVFDLCVIVAGSEDCDPPPFSDVASRTVLADLVFSGHCVAVSHANSSASLTDRLDFSTDAVTLTYFINRTLKGVHYAMHLYKVNSATQCLGPRSIRSCGGILSSPILYCTVL